jgi:hypothetical protein
MGDPGLAAPEAWMLVKWIRDGAGDTWVAPQTEHKYEYEHEHD